jgi:hypothetical protein
MARTFELIKAAMKTDIRTNYPSLNNFKFPEDVGGSTVSVFNTLIAVYALAIYTFEVLVDALQSQVQAIADQAHAGNAQWIQRQILNFQFGDTLTLVNGYPLYATITPANRIVTQCAIVQTSGGLLNIKVAKGISPALSPLSGAELIALKDYYFGTSTSQGIGFAGVNATFISLAADRLYIAGTVYFYGQFVQATVSAAVILAINNFLATFQNTAFNGTVFMIRLTDAIQAVPGVSRIAYTSIKGRDNATAFAGAIPIDFQQSYSAVAGYLISEDTVGNTLTDSLTFVQES